MHMILYAPNRLMNKLLGEERDPTCVDELFFKTVNVLVEKR